MSSFLSRGKNFAENRIHSLKTSLLVDVYYPESWIGSKLEGKDRILFDKIKLLIDRYFSLSMNQALLVEINDFMVKEVCVSRSSYLILNEVMKYIRIKLLSSNVVIIEHAVLLLDFLVKNSVDYKVHLYIGQRKMMKTLSVVGRRQAVKSGYNNHMVAETIFDCIQAWGEAFYSRCDNYPHIWATYAKLRYHYRIQFPRPYFDPTRVPIFLGATNTQSYDEIARYSAMMGSNATGEQDEDDDSVIDFPTFDDKDEKTSSYPSAPYRGDETQSITYQQSNQASVELDNLLFFDEGKDDAIMPQKPNTATDRNDNSYYTTYDLLTPRTTTSSTYANDILALLDGSILTPTKHVDSYNSSINTIPAPAVTTYPSLSPVIPARPAPPIPLFEQAPPTPPSRHLNQTMIASARPSLSGECSARDQPYDHTQQSFDTVISNSVNDMKDSLSKASVAPKKPPQPVNTHNVYTGMYTHHRIQPTMTTVPTNMAVKPILSTYAPPIPPPIAPSMQFPSEPSETVSVREEVPIEGRYMEPMQSVIEPIQAPPTKPPRKQVSYMPPTSYADVQVTYYGFQRVARNTR